jgi:superfamily I DNA/RNA helicase
MFDYKSFVSENRSLLIAPAGYGKTHTLAECLKYTSDGDKQLILTHTHAGIASIKEKISKQNIAAPKYLIETITGFAQKYVLAFYCGDELPDQDNSNDYYSFIISQATKLFYKASILRVVSTTYKGLFVDEYQDCTKDQHQMIMAISRILPTHIFGDPLQGIMDFNSDLVSIDDDLKDFMRFPELCTPYRWFTDGNNMNLGNALKEIRRELSMEGVKKLDLSKYGNETLFLIKVNDNDIHNPESLYRKGLKKLILNPNREPAYDSLLILVPEYFENDISKGNIFDRAKLRSEIDYSFKLILLEAIDDKSFYSIARGIDSLISTIHRARKKNKKIINDVLKHLFYKTSINDWFNSNCQVKKKQGDNKLLSIKLDQLINQFISDPSQRNLLTILLYLKNDLKFKYLRQDLIWSLLKAIKNAIAEEESVYNCMVNQKNTIRRVGRKIHGKCIGTTLLTKGLEFDTVAILDAHKFDCPKHFYVALTRASKRLIIFSKEERFAF